MAQRVIRRLDSTTLTEIDTNHTKPVYLVKMMFTEGEYYVSSGKAITFEGNVYVSGQVNVGTFRWSNPGQQEGDIELFNENNSASALVLNNKVSDVPIEIYKTYVKSDDSNTTPVLLVKGVMDEPVITPYSAKINVLSSRSLTEFIPRRYYTVSEGFNFLPSDGQVINWNNERFVLESDRG